MANKPAQKPQPNRAGKVAMQLFVPPKVRNRFRAACALVERDMVEVLIDLMNEYADARNIPDDVPPIAKAHPRRPKP